MNLRKGWSVISMLGLDQAVGHLDIADLENMGKGQWNAFDKRFQFNPMRRLSVTVFGNTGC